MYLALGGQSWVRLIQLDYVPRKCRYQNQTAAPVQSCANTRIQDTVNLMLHLSYQKAQHCLCSVCKTDLRTESAESRRIRGDSSKGWPSLSQLIWGWGVPVALHSSVTTLCWVVCTSRGTLVSPLMEGGTVVQKVWKSIHRFVLCTKKLYKDICSHPKQTRYKFCSLGRRSWQPGRCMFLSPLVLYSEVLECSHLERYCNTHTHISKSVSATVNYKRLTFLCQAQS